MSASTMKTDPTLVSPKGQLLRPLPRQRSQFPKFRPVDVLWILFVALLPNFLAQLPGLHGRPVEKFIIPEANAPLIGEWISAIALSLIGPCIYMALFGNRDKNAAMIASLSWSGCVYIQHFAQLAPFTALFSLLLIAAFAAMSYDLTIFAGILLALATAVNPAGAVFAIVFLASLINRQARQSLAASVWYIGLTAASVASLCYLARHGESYFHGFGSYHWRTILLIGRAATPSFMSCWWFAFPFLGEIAKSEPRKKLSPIILAVAGYLILASFVTFPIASVLLLPSVPFLFIIVGIGVSRVIPIIAGDIRGVELRHFVAFVAATSLIALNFHNEWRALRHLRLVEVKAEASVGAQQPIQVIKTAYQAPPRQPTTQVASVAKPPALHTAPVASPAVKPAPATPAHPAVVTNAALTTSKPTGSTHPAPVHPAVWTPKPVVNSWTPKKPVYWVRPKYVRRWIPWHRRYWAAPKPVSHKSVAQPTLSKNKK